MDRRPAAKYCDACVYCYLGGTMPSLFRTGLAAAMSVAVVSIGLAGPAAADDDSWVMPGPLRGASLASAQSALQPILDATGHKVDLRDVNGPAQNITNATNWVVCWQSPKAGKKVTKKTWIGLGVRRPGTEC